MDKKRSTSTDWRILVGRSDGHGCQVNKWAIGAPEKSAMKVKSM